MVVTQAEQRAAAARAVLCDAARLQRRALLGWHAGTAAQRDARQLAQRAMAVMCGHHMAAYFRCW